MKERLGVGQSSHTIDGVDKTGEGGGFGGEAFEHLRSAACVERVGCVYTDHDVGIMGAARIE